jgi:hypothetical protein
MTTQTFLQTAMHITVFTSLRSRLQLFVSGFAKPHPAGSQDDGVWSSGARGM